MWNLRSLDSNKDLFPYLIHFFVFLLFFRFYPQCELVCQTVTHWGVGIWFPRMWWIFLPRRSTTERARRSAATPWEELWAGWRARRDKTSASKERIWVEVLTFSCLWMRFLLAIMADIGAGTGQEDRPLCKVTVRDCGSVYSCSLRGCKSQNSLKK